MAKGQQTFTGMYEFFDALEAALQSTDWGKRQELANVIDRYWDDFPEDLAWATSAESPTLLSNLFMTIDLAAREQPRPSRGTVVRLIDRKPEGSA